LGRVILAVTGSIAAYKAVEVLREFQRRGWEVRVVMTRAATHFVAPLTFQTLSEKRVIVDQFRDVFALEHIELCREADALLVAPATADFIAKMAAGLADDFPSSLYLACKKPVFVAPAMNEGMLMHPATRRNLEILREHGVRIIEPEEGPLACEEEGLGRLAEPARVVFQVLSSLGSRLRGRKVLVTAGPTREFIDEVRFISNPSTGKQGLAIAHQAALMGAEVHLLLSSASPFRSMVSYETFTSGEELRERLKGKDYDLLFMTAAVGDFRPAKTKGGKLRRQGRLTLDLEATPDILAEICSSKRPGQFVVAFAAETEDFLQRAKKKLGKKGADAIFVNPVGRGVGFGQDENRGWLIFRDGSIHEIPPSSKEEVARRIIELVIEKEEI